MKDIFTLCILVILFGYFYMIHNKDNITAREKNQKVTTAEISSEHVPWEIFKEKSFKKNTVIIDIRTPEEISKGKLFNQALEIDYHTENFKEKISRLDKNKTYLIYCRSGNRTGKAIPIFKDQGLIVFGLEGGYINVPTKNKETSIID